MKVTSTEFQQNVGRYQDAALQAPVFVTRNGRDRTVLISAEEFRRLKRRDRDVLAIEAFTEEDIALVSKSEPSPEAEAFDQEIVP